MASNYTLENAIIALVGRADELKANVENDTPDLDFVAVELSYISDRAGELRDAANGLEKILSEL